MVSTVTKSLRGHWFVCALKKRRHKCEFVEHVFNNLLIKSNRNKVTERLTREVVQKATISQQVCNYKLACLWICFPHVMPVATHAEQKVALVESYYLQPVFCCNYYKFQKCWEKKCCTLQNISKVINNLKSCGPGMNHIQKRCQWWV